MTQNPRTKQYHTITSKDVDRILRALWNIPDPAIREAFISGLEKTARPQGDG